MLEETIGIRVSREEWAMIKKAARADDRPVSAWARRILLEEARKANIDVLVVKRDGTGRFSKKNKD